MLPFGFVGLVQPTINVSNIIFSRYILKVRNTEYNLKNLYYGDDYYYCYYYISLWIRCKYPHLVMGVDYFPISKFYKTLI